VGETVCQVIKGFATGIEPKGQVAFARDM
jgi:hypothetical protein